MLGPGLNVATLIAPKARADDQKKAREKALALYRSWALIQVSAANCKFVSDVYLAEKLHFEQQHHSLRSLPPACSSCASCSSSSASVLAVGQALE